jgi:hypothetical protein
LSQAAAAVDNKPAVLILAAAAVLVGSVAALQLQVAEVPYLQH